MASEFPEDTNPKLWRSSDEYRYPVPKPHGDHWDIMLEHFLTKDKLQCDAWKDEVQNLLIFAGLFSAVVTAFAVESYKTLQPDPNVTLTFLLAHIATGIDTLANSSDRAISMENIPQYPVSFSPTSTSIHINIFWFSSLILSLTTVIIGIVSLQWLREHQRYTEPLSPKRALAVFHLRSTALNKWGIPHIFATLPLLLQGAVVLFFTGLGEFLFVLDPVVAVPALVLIGLPIIFLVGTTILPTLQLMLASFRLSSTYSIPTQCPYKSPQSWAFLHLFLLGIQIPYIFRRILGRIPWVSEVFPSLTPIRNIFSTKVFTKSTILPRIPLPLNIQVAFNRENWIGFDISWLTLRDTYFLSQQEAVIRMGDSIRPTYDLVQAIASSAKDHSIHEEVVLAAYHGLKELCDAVVGDEMLELDLGEHESETKHLINIARITVLQSGFPTFHSESYSEGFNLRVMRDETMLAFLHIPGICDHSSNMAHPIGLHRMELFTRMLVYNRFREVGNGKKKVDPTHPLFTEMKPVERAWEIPEAFFEAMVQQHYLILEDLFDQAANLPASGVITAARYSMLVKYFNYFTWFPSPQSLETNFLTVLSTISKGLTFSLESRGYYEADFLFFCARLYLENVARDSWFSDLMKFGSYRIRRNFLALLKTMLRYERQLDKSTYCNMTRTWESEFPPRNSGDINPPNPIRLPYEPIPQILLRFIGYEQRDSSPQTPHFTIQVYDHVELSEVPDKVDLDGVTRISFVESPEYMTMMML